MYSLATFVKIAKNYALDPSVSDENFLNAILEPYVEAGRIKAREKKDFYLNKGRTSLILSGHSDVPKCLRKALSLYDIRNRTAKCFDAFINEMFDEQSFGIFVNDIINSMYDESSGNADCAKQLKLLSDNPKEFFAYALLEAIKRSNIAENSKTLWQDGVSSLALAKGDLLKKGFGRKKRSKDIVVIPVNSAFDTEVTFNYQQNPFPLVSDKTVHGQWLIRMYKSGWDAKTISEAVCKDLKAQKIKPSRKIERKTETINEYPIGTIAVIESDSSIFFLLAISDFDKNNNAQSTRENIENAVLSLLKTYDRRGQSHDLFLPLIGTGKSRANLKLSDSLQLIIKSVLTNKELIQGKISIVVLPEQYELLSSAVDIKD